MEIIIFLKALISLKALILAGHVAAKKDDLDDHLHASVILVIICKLKKVVCCL